MTNKDDKKATKMTVAIGWGVVIGFVIKLLLDDVSNTHIALFELLVFAVGVLVLTLLITQSFLTPVEKGGRDDK